MSELKARGVDDVYIEYYNTGKHELAEVYLKSEADREIRKQKHKRCLSMAQICYTKSWNCLQYISPREKYDFWRKWQTRWTELAYKFKECV